MTYETDELCSCDSTSGLMVDTGLPPANAPNSSDLYENIAYDKYWQRADRQKLNDLEHAIVNELLPLTGQRIIDLGCGYGRLADCYINRFGISVMFDGSRSLLQAAQKITGGKALYVLGDINHLPFKTAAFDCALMVRTFHHLDDSLSFIKNLRKILCGGGSFIMNYSNKRNVHRILKYLLRKNRSHSPFSCEPDTTEPNFIHHHPDFIKKLLENAGFNISDIRGAGILDKLAGVLPTFLFPILPTGKTLAKVFGKLLLTPWIFLKATVNAGETLLPAATAEELLNCPQCGSQPVRSTSGFYCIQCQKVYPLDDGIIDMRISTNMKN